MRGNVGVRVVRTKQFARSSDSVERFNDYFVDNASGAPMSCDDPAADPNLRCQGGFVRLPDAQVRDKVYALSSLEKTYTDVLPSFNIAWDITDNLVLRGAASKVVARPSYTSIAYPGGLRYISESTPTIAVSPAAPTRPAGTARAATRRWSRSRRSSSTWAWSGTSSRARSRVFRCSARTWTTSPCRWCATSR